MKTINCILIITFIFFKISNSLSDSIFGIKLGANINGILTETYIKKNKYKYPESKRLYYEIYLDSSNSKLFQKSTYFDEYFVAFDLDEKIHQITGMQKYKSRNRCENIGKKLATIIEKQFKIKLKKGNKKSYPKRDMFVDYHNHKNKNYDIGLTCNEHFEEKENEIFMFVYLSTKQMTIDVKEFYGQL